MIYICTLFERFLMFFYCTAIKVEKKEGEKIDYNKLKVKELKALLGKFVVLSLDNF